MKDSHPPLTFNHNIVYQTTSEKHLGIILDNSLSFEEHLRPVFSKINRIIDLPRKLQCLIPRSSLLTIYKTFVQLILIMVTLSMKKPSNACLTITGAIKRYFRRKALRWTRSRVPSTPSLFEKVLLLLKILQKWISSVSFQIKVFLLQHWKCWKHCPFQIKTYFFQKFVFSISCYRVEKSWP